MTLEQLDAGEGIPLSQVMHETREKYESQKNRLSSPRATIFSDAYSKPITKWVCLWSAVIVLALLQTTKNVWKISSIFMKK